jgi:uncharacterized protein YhbP (UPF0306 family)
MTEPDVRGAVREFLSSQSTLTLATLGDDGRPMAASLFFVSDDDLCLYWVSGPASRHSHNVRQRADVAVTVHNQTWSWMEIMGVQMEGRVSVIPAGDEWHAVWERYLAKFPFVREFEAEVSRSNFYRFTPRWARLINNKAGFGHKDEITF